MMKKLILLLCLFCSSQFVFAQLKVHRNGNVTVGVLPKSVTSKLSVGGTVKAEGLVVPYDKNVMEPLFNQSGDKNAADILSSLMLVEVMSSVEPKEIVQEDDSTWVPRYALSPNVLKKLYPGLVIFDSDGMPCVNYIGLIPLLMGGIQELQYEIETLKATLASLGKGMRQTRGFSDSTSDSQHIDATLLQNVPNPARGKTSIGYTLPEDIVDAAIQFFDMNGRIVKSVNVLPYNSYIDVDTAELPSGLYIYSLLADGLLIDSKKMIVSK